MRHFIRFILGLCMFVVLITVFISCEKPKEAKLVVSESEFVLNQASPYSYSIDAKGKIKNIGEVDVKKVRVTGYCKSCFNGLNPGKWTISERERAPEEFDVINYIVAGGEADFSFNDVAVMYNTVPEPPEKMPEQMGISIVSYEIVD